MEGAGPAGRAVHPALVPLGVPEGDPRQEQVGPEAFGGAVERTEPLRRPVERTAAAALEQRRRPFQELEHQPVGVGQVVVAEGDAPGGAHAEGLQDVGVDRRLPAEPAPVAVGGVVGAVDVGAVLAVHLADVAGGRAAGHDLGVKGSLERPWPAIDHRALPGNGAEHRSQHPGGIVELGRARGAPILGRKHASLRSPALPQPPPAEGERRRRNSDVTDSPLRPD